MESLKKFVKEEVVLVVSWILAVISAFFVKPSLNYLGYIDFRVLAILFCLMIIIKGFSSINLFDIISKKLIGRISSVKKMTFVFVMLCFFASMFITNDVALLTFVPISLFVLKGCSGKKVIFCVVMETIAANLGSMATPIGNPQNLFIYYNYNVSIGEFISIIGPLTVFFLVIIVATLALAKDEKINTQVKDIEKIGHEEKKKFYFFIALFIVAILAVLKILDYKICFIIIALAMAIIDRKLFKEVDYALLLTFVGFFIFAGNIKSIDAVKNFIFDTINGNELVVSFCASQVFSNVPSAIMLSSFTSNYRDLFLGVNIGGLGTLIASMASLISYKFYAREYKKTNEYFIEFTKMNVIYIVLAFIFTFVCL